MTTPNETKPVALAETLDGGRCAVDAGFGEVCCDCVSVLDPNRYFKWLRDSDRKPLCDECSAKYDLL